MKRLLLALSVAACGEDDGLTRSTCDEMTKAVTQRHGTCRLAPDPSAPFNMCPIVVDAYCGNEANCPSGWSIGCEVGPSDESINCTYGDSASCTMVDADTVEFSQVQTLNGVDGLAVIIDGEGLPFGCEFRPCSPL